MLQVDIKPYQDNPQRPQDMIATAFQRFAATGHVILPEQRRIYQQLAERVKFQPVLEAGCGIGLGTSLFQHAARCDLLGTDLDFRHVAFARGMFPQCRFDVWDISQGPYREKFDVVVAVEVLEHVSDYQAALANLVASATEEVWLSTPNRRNPEMGTDRPRNVHHVHEFLPQELLALAKPLCRQVTVHHWDGLAELDAKTEVTPLVYRLVL